MSSVMASAVVLLVASFVLPASLIVEVENARMVSPKGINDVISYPWIGTSVRQRTSNWIKGLIGDGRVD